MLAQSILGFKPPLNVFGNIVTETSAKSSETIDIKHSLSPVIMFARIYALHNNIRTRGTVDRMNILKKLKVLTPQTCDEIIFHFNFLMLLRIRHQINQIDEKVEISNFVEPKKLSEMDQYILKKVFNQINSYQDNLNASFMGGQLGI
jgi:CBS domain-containing protein